MRERNLNVEEEDYSAIVTSCVPYLFIRLMLANLGMNLNDLTDEEKSCLVERTDDIGLTGDNVTPEEEVEYSEAIAGQVSCVPGLSSLDVLSAFGITIDDLGQEEMACLRNAEGETDLAAVFREYSFHEFLGTLVPCIPNWEESADRDMRR